MNWYKIATNKLETFEDRNALNQRIRAFKDIVIKINAFGKQIGYQSAEAIRKELEKIAKDKKFSSFPVIKQILDYAVDTVRDNYKNFKNICKQSVDKLYNEIEKLEIERKEFVEKVLPEKMRKLRDKGKNK
jgi:hypothetical protein